MTSKSKPMQMLRNINKEREKTNISKENADYFIKKYQKIQEKCTQKDDWVQLNCVLNIMLIACVADNECLEIGLAYSHKALDDLMPAINADTINPYTDLGQCQAQVIREATSNIAWYESQDINEQKRLEELLEIINLNIKCYVTQIRRYRTRFFGGDYTRSHQFSRMVGRFLGYVIFTPCRFYTSLYY